MKYSSWNMKQLPCSMMITIVMSIFFSALLFAQEDGKIGEIKSSPTASPSQEEIKKDRLERMKIFRERLQDESSMAEENRAKLINAIIKECGLSPENVKPLMLELERELFTLRTTQATRPLQRRILAETINEIANAKSDREKSDKVLEGLEKIAKYHNDLRTNLEKQRAAGVISETELINSNVECVEADMRVAVRREELTKSNGIGNMEHLNREIQEQATAEKTDAVRLALLEEHLEKLRGVQGMVNDVDKLNEHIKRLSRKIDQVEELLLDIELELPVK